MNELPTPISDWSVSLAPAEKTGAEHTLAPVSRLKTTMSIGFALSVMPTSPLVVIVGVVPDPTSVCPGFIVPSFGYVERQVTWGDPSAPATKRYRAASLT